MKGQIHLLKLLFGVPLLVLEGVLLENGSRIEKKARPKLDESCGTLYLDLFFKVILYGFCTIWNSSPLCKPPFGLSQIQNQTIYLFRGNQRMQMYGTFEGFHLNSVLGS